MSKGNGKKISLLEEKIAELETENSELRQELIETSQGTLLLYNEIEHKNTELEKALEDLKASEEARVDSARTAAMGSIVVTMNHEINNPLAIIQGNLDLIDIKAGTLNDDIRSKLDKIKNAISRITDVMSKIQQYRELLTTAYLDVEMLDLHNKQDPEENPGQKERRIS